MKFKDYGNGYFQVGITEIFVKREDTKTWRLCIRRDGRMHLSSALFATRKFAVQYYFKHKKEIEKYFIESRPADLPVRPKREQPKQLVNFMRELKDI